MMVFILSDLLLSLNRSLLGVVMYLLVLALGEYCKPHQLADALNVQSMPAVVGNRSANDDSFILLE